MELSCLWVSARAAAFQLDDGGLYELTAPCALWLNGLRVDVTSHVVTPLYDLAPQTDYLLEAERAGERIARLRFRTKKESATLNVLDFGAVGDGEHDDTPAIQAAIACCPPEGRVLVPAGRYAVTPLFLKSGLRLEIQRDAALLLATDRRRFPMLPGLAGDRVLGAWEGVSAATYASLLTGVDARDVEVYGPGTLDGQAQLSDWWVDPKTPRGAWRGRMLYLCRCENVTVQGLTVQNSPAWNVHPYYSRDLRFLGLTILAPQSSPNTDGLNPECCQDVLVAGVRFSVGDDCVAVKAGKRALARRFPAACERVTLSHCLMEDGHGGVTIGSEMSGGVRQVTVRDCLMRHTDRGLRIKTRRGRGGVVDDICLERVRMERVGAPITVNDFYFCDADGHSEAVQSRAPAPVDDDTPTLGALAFRRVEAVDCGACAGYFLGLPESPVGEVRMEDVLFSFADAPEALLPVMADGVAACAGRGIIARNVRRLTLRNVRILGQRGEPLDCEGVSALEEVAQP